MTKEESAEDALMRLSEALKLSYEAQDWGIVNADASRVGEFIEYYNAHADLVATQKFELGGLILASANEVLLAEPDADLGDALVFILRHANDFLADFDYWRGLDDDSEFLLGGRLRAVPEPEAFETAEPD